VRIRTALKVLAGFLGAILIGAIGSGVWERILSPFLTWISSLVTDGISALSSEYANSIYSSAARPPDSGSAIAIVLLILLLVFTGMLGFALRSKRDNSVIRFVHDTIVEAWSGWRGILGTCALIAFVLFQLAQAAAVTEVRRYSLTQLAIVRPYIGESSHKFLYSEFLQVKSKQDFEKFLEKMYGLAEEAGFQVEKFEG